MNPSRLETTCKVTLDPIAFHSLDIILLTWADIDQHVMPKWGDAFSRKERSYKDSAEGGHSTLLLV
jgi:hypothetical protein